MKNTILTKAKRQLREAIEMYNKFAWYEFTILVGQASGLIELLEDEFNFKSNEDNELNELFNIATDLLCNINISR